MDGRMERLNGIKEGLETSREKSPPLPSFFSGITYKQLYLFSKKELEKAGISDAAFDAISLFEHFFAINRQKLAARGDEQPPGGLLLSFWKALQKRANRFPLQYILGSWSFDGMELKVGEGVLIPREETELLVRLSEKLFKDSVYLQEKLQEIISAQGKEGSLAGTSAEDPMMDPAIAPVVDLCSGTGAVALALSGRLPGIPVFALEKLPKAYAYLEENIRLTGRKVKALQADILSPAAASCFPSLSAVISNPPYIETKELPALQPEVCREPSSALDGGEDGLVFYKAIAELWLPKLVKGGVCALEIGESQAQPVLELLRRAGLRELCVYQDFNGFDRVVTGIREEKQE